MSTTRTAQVFSFPPPYKPRPALRLTPAARLTARALLETCRQVIAMRYADGTITVEDMEVLGEVFLRGDICDMLL